MTQFCGKNASFGSKTHQNACPFRFYPCKPWMLEELGIDLVPLSKITMKKEVFWLFF
jgi:hypothetical protein